MRQKLEKWWKRIIAVGLVISLLSVGFVIYPKQQKIVLTFGMFAGNKWDVPDDNCYQMIDQVIKEFEKEYPNVTIKYESGVMKDDYSEWLSQKALKGDLPDVFMVLPEDFSTFSSVGMLKNLDSYTKIDKAFKKSNYYEGSYDAGTYKGTQYALPYESVPTLMLVNKTLLKKEHIKMPGNHWTWDDFYNICENVTKDIDGDNILDQFGVYGYDWKHAIYSNDALLINKDGYVNVTDENFIESVEFMRKLSSINNNIVLTSEMFDKGQIVFCPMDLSQYRTYKPYPWRVKKYSSFKWDVIPLPKGPKGDNTSIIQTSLIGVKNNSYGKNELAFEFANYLSSSIEVQSNIIKYSQGLSVLKKATNSYNTMQVLLEDTPDNSDLNLSILDEVMNKGIPLPSNINYIKSSEIIDLQLSSIVNSDESLDIALLRLKKKIMNYIRNES